MERNSQLSRAAVVMSAAALLISIGAAGGPALAQAVFATNSDKVDGLHAVKASATLAKRKGKLVATSGTTGRLPNSIIAKAPDAGRLDGLDSTDFLKAASTAGHLVAVGRVYTGTSPTLEPLAGPAGMTATKGGTGSYSLLIPGLRPGCTGLFPDVMLTAYGGHEVTLQGGSTQCASGDVALWIATADGAGAPTDGSFQYLVYSQTQPPGAPRQSPKGNPTRCVDRPDGRRTCS